MKIIWSFTAEKDLDAIRTYYLQFSDRTAARICGNILATSDKLLNFPLAGRQEPKLGPGIRALVADAYYTLIYELSNDIIYIHAVWDVRQRHHKAHRFPQGKHRLKRYGHEVSASLSGRNLRAYQ